MSGYRLPLQPGQGAWPGAWIDRSRTLSLRFNCRTLTAHPGDTLASALLANGIGAVARSFKWHRPRGIFSAGLEEPTGLVDVGNGARRTPNTRATDIEVFEGLEAVTGNAWPSLGFDLGALAARFASLMPAGFYYKTFMWPHWHRFEPAIRRAAGLGHAAAADAGADPDHYEEVSRQVETLVIGGGAAGLVAAAAAARGAQEVLLLEAAPRCGGWLASQGPEGIERATALEREARAAGVKVIVRCTALGLYDHRLAVAVEEVNDGDASNGPRERLWKLRAKRIVLALGAFERPMLFPDNDRPGVMLAAAVQRHAALFGVAAGRRVVVAAACDSGYVVARGLAAMGVQVAAVVDVRPGRQGFTPELPAGVAWHAGCTMVGVDHRRGAVGGVHIAPQAGGHALFIEADGIASAGGWSPAVHLHSMAGGGLRWEERASMFVPAGPLPGITSVGAAAGAFEFDAALAHAQAEGARAPGTPGTAAPVGGLGDVPAHAGPSGEALAALAAGGRRTGKVFVDLQNDVTTDDIALAARENYRSVEHLKRYTTLGMATDQGKTSNVLALVLMGEHTQRAPAQVGTTKFRPPFRPVTLNALAAGRHGARMKPLKRLPAERWHQERGALFEEFGGWWRPAAYPRGGGESLTAAAEREALAVRRGVGLFDGSPLGKIEVYGPDAAAFLDLMYVGTMSTLPVGGTRYGLLLNENGVIFDDGIVARLGPDHFWVNTTSGGAERVALAFEEWLQCEYVNLRLLVTPVTSAWGNVTVSGPRAWELLRGAGFDAALAPTAMKHMTVGEWPAPRRLLDARRDPDEPLAHEADGVALRVLRASYTGELSYEINVPATLTPALLEHLWRAGQPLGMVPFGVEALMILRTEKGYLHVGGDTDGTTLPGDVGMDRGIAKKAANFAGRRSLLRPAATDAHRMQLVGLVPCDRRTVLPAGAHATAQRPPAPIEGFVTSSHFSPNLNHPVALAMLRRGASRTGERITWWHMGTPVEAEVVKTPFIDPGGERLHGHVR
ncbi:MAG: (2Fe-2S)-binding protein [Rubrivivax sp.]|nr:(2Fe-2S)-binding protein [Rubrivivax sp.]